MTGLFDRDEALGSGPEMPVMPNAAILAAGAHDQPGLRARGTRKISQARP
jgi:hypothetical protein